MLTQQIKSDVIYGDQNFFVSPQLNYGAFVLQKILGYKDKVALINGASEEQITYRELAQKIVNLSTSLRRLGVKEGDVVAICSENRIEYLITALSVFCVGGIITFFNNAYTKDDLIHALNISKPKYMFLSGDIYKTQYETLKNKGNISEYVIFDDVSPLSNGCYKDLVRQNVEINSFTPVDFEGTPKTCMILYSSGTTGPAKGAMLTHLNLIVASQQPLAIQRNNIIPLTIAPWSSTMGIICTLKEIVFGRTLVFLPKYFERTYIKTIEKYKVGILVVAPPLIVMLCKSTLINEFDISSVEIIYSGGAPVNPEVIQQLKNRFPHIKHVLQGYGMTEASGAVTEDLEHSPKEGSVGKIVPGNIIRIVDPDTNKTVGRGEPGEVRIKGLVLFGGYIAKDMQNDFDDEGFYKTGDIAYCDEEGYFYIVDRIKELIKYKAWQVAPSELEALILQHPSVKDVGVTGAPDLLAGELPTAFVVRQPGADVTAKDIVNFVATKVAPWKRLRGGVIFLNEIPKTASGKILRRKLQELLPKQSVENPPRCKL